MGFLIKNINLTIEPCKMDDSNDEDEMTLMYDQAVFDEEISTLVQDISEFSSQVVTYIAEFVVHGLLKSIKCNTCCSALIADAVDDNQHSFIKLKDKGGLIFPSKDVVIICKRMEVIIKSSVLSDGKIKVSAKYMHKELMSKTLPHFIGMKLLIILISTNVNNHQSIII